MNRCYTTIVVALTMLPAVSGVREQFANPPPEAKLQAWYHWTTTGITDDCIVADLAALADLGVGMAHIFMPGQEEIPPHTQPLSPDWWKRWETTVREAKKHGIKLGFHNCPGWSSSGGKWIRPEDSMKVLIASETDVERLSGTISLKQPRKACNFYRDVAVFALPIARPSVPSHISGNFKADYPAFQDGRQPLTLPTASNDKGCELIFEYEKPFTPSALVTSWDESQFHLDITAFASDDAKNWQTAGRYEYRLYNAQKTPKVMPLHLTAAHRFFKIKIDTVQPPPWVRFIRRKLRSATFTTLPYVIDVDTKNGAACSFSYSAAADDAPAGICRDSIINLTEYLNGDGKLTVPESKSIPAPPAGCIYRLLRVGYTTTGICCAPSPRNLCGLECDKLNRRGLDAHWPNMPAKMITAPGASGTVAVAIVDSYEVGGQNWTEDFPAAFEKRRGYSITPWLPAMVGYIVGTAAETSKFLYDVQHTISELFAENYYDYFAEKCHAADILAATESYGGPFDSLRCFAASDIPTGEFWLGRPLKTSPRVASSAGHLHGRNHIAAEAFTTDAMEGRWQITPHEFRVNGDRGWLSGISQLVYHSYLQQPFTHVQPGYSLGHHGTQFNRNSTWWPEGKWWAQYVQRGQFLLQSGKPQADLLIFAGDSTPINYQLPENVVETGYNFDFCGTDDLHRLTAHPQGLAIPGNQQYAVLWLGNDRYLTLSTLRKIKELLIAGARIAGQPPIDTPTLSDDPAAWQAEVKSIWNGDFENLKKADSAISALQAFAIRPPVESHSGISAIHRIIDNRDFYFVVNHHKTKFDECVSFAGIGRPERWDAKTGEITPLPWYEGDTGRVNARLTLQGEESAFVSFRNPHADEMPLPRKAKLNPTPEAMCVADLSKDWSIVSFSGKNPPSAPLKQATLASWSDAADKKLRYFAGRAVYEKALSAGDLKAGDAKTIILDLGEVREIANVSLDGEFIACLWEAPYHLKIPIDRFRAAAKLQVEVINTWPNRLIGDAKARAEGAAEPKGEGGLPKWVLEDKPDSGTGIFTWANWLAGWKANDNLRPAGLIGPVRLLREP